jgi:hypothetical protein
MNQAELMKQLCRRFAMNAEQESFIREICGTFVNA